MNDKIINFVAKRPKLVAGFGYGSGVFKQAGYTSKDKPQLDLIFVVDDQRKWHLENMKLSPKDYSFVGRLYFKYRKISKLKGRTGIAYISNIKEDGSIFKYGTIEAKDLIEYLESWKSFYLPGRLQKPIYIVTDNEEISKAIQKNRDNALLLSCLLQNEEKVSKKDLLATLCGLSYLGDTRMKHFETPGKVLNIVEGNFDALNEIYKFDKSYLKVDGDNIIIDRDELNKYINELPSELLEYINPYLNESHEVLVAKIKEFFETMTKGESIRQTIKGVGTNGPIRSIAYAYQKLKKSFKK